MAKRNDEDREANGRIKILETAAEIFAEKGFDGARVDEIAKRAGVNKALIYYHFESKEKILDELLKKYIDDTIQQKHMFFNEINFNDPTCFNEYIEKNFTLVKEARGEILKIAVVEALKNNKQSDSLFKVMDTFFTDLVPMWSERGLNIKEKLDEDLMINAFFFGMAPVIFYIILGDKWAEFYNVDKDVLYKKFIATLNETYVKKFFKPLIENEK